jgi:phosphatidylglycerophosphate synthase
VIVVTVAVVNLAIGRRTFKPSAWGKAATAIYIVTALIFMVCNYLRAGAVLLTICVYASLGITIISALHYITHAAHIINEPDDRR